MNLDVELVDLPGVSKEGQMFVLTRIRLNLRGEDGDLDVELVDLPGVYKEAQMFVLTRIRLSLRGEDGRMSMKHKLKCNKKSSCYNGGGQPGEVGQGLR